MCFHQQIHTAHRGRHICDRDYPSSELDMNEVMAPGDHGSEKCPLHSCCHVSRELVFECAAARAARERVCGVAEGAVWGECACAPDAVYEDIVFVLFKKGPEPVWDMGCTCGKFHAEDKSRKQRPRTRLRVWELLWDADDEASEEGGRDDDGDDDDQPGPGERRRRQGEIMIGIGISDLEFWADADAADSPPSADVTRPSDKAFVFLEDVAKVLDRGCCGEGV
ncbi:hypothetical protein DL771_000316 [Monosporascus sp. 5C6A]|nr:hypothetical protein DL771_000316 [Monosporascus sp. 5C6A]